MHGILDYWEIPNNLPEKSPTAIVGMSLSPRRDGRCSRIGYKVVVTAADLATFRNEARCIFSNGFFQNGFILSDMMKQLALDTHCVQGQIISPSKERNKQIRCTYDELVFAFEAVHNLPDIAGEEKSLLVVAEAVHMRRTLMTARKIGKSFPDIKIYWSRVWAYDFYDTDTVQVRFRHPLLFLAYEMSAICYSKIVGWV
jgi:hypothetical protein